MPYALVACVFGGVLTLAVLLLRQCAVARRCWRARPGSCSLHDAQAGIPYGVALAAGAFFLLPPTEIFRLAAAA